jgi:uncharacterized protein YggE
MKLLLSLVSILLLNQSQLLFAQYVAIAENQLTVYGSAILYTPADRANISFEVKGFGPSIQTAVDVARKKVSDIAGKLIEAGLKEKNLNTSTFNSGDNYEGKAFLSSQKDFRTSMTVYVTVDSLPLLENVVGILASSPVDKLSNITFAPKSDSTMKLEVRRLAIADAQRKARMMVEQLGITLGKVVEVEELNPGDRIRLDAATSVSSGSSPIVSFYAQQLSVTAGVKIIFQIVNK